MPITEQDRSEWYHHPVTQAYLQSLRDGVEEIKENWSLRGYVGDSLEQGALSNAKAIGEVDALRETIAWIESLRPNQEG